MKEVYRIENIFRGDRAFLKLAQLLLQRDWKIESEEQVIIPWEVVDEKNRIYIPGPIQPNPIYTAMSADKKTVKAVKSIVDSDDFVILQATFRGYKRYTEQRTMEELLSGVNRHQDDKDLIQESFNQKQLIKSTLLQQDTYVDEEILNDTLNYLEGRVPELMLEIVERIEKEVLEK